MSLFDGFLKEICDTKPEIGRELIFIKDGAKQPCVVDAHCGYDFFHVKLIGKRESWHLSLRGYGKSWKYKGD